MVDWYSGIEEPLRELVKLLRNNGVNTTSSCGHLPSPYIEIDWFDDRDVTKIYNLLVENEYGGFVITACWSHIDATRYIRVVFHPAKRLAQISDIKA